MTQLTDKFLNAQTTPEEEHLLAQLLREAHEAEDMDQWLTEDETTVYDRIVAERKRQHWQRRTWRWAVAAGLVLMVATGATLLWPRAGAETETVGTMSVADKVDTIPVTPTLPAAPIKPTASTPSVKSIAHHKPRPAAATTDSLQYYIARLEQELDNVTDSDTYVARAEQVIRADARLQRLVQRIMIGELTRDDQPAEAMNINLNQEEEQP